LRAAVAFVPVVCALPVLPVTAQDTNAPASALAKQSTPVINYRERPRYPFDPQRLKRRPNLDGVIVENEWDALYTIGDRAVNGTVYVNWDEDYLYVAARTGRPAVVVFDLDANADGWLRGADNLELVVVPPGEGGGPVLTARVLDAAGSRDAPVWNERVVDPKSIQIVMKAAGGGQVFEMAIPKGIAGLNPRLNATLSCRADFLPADAAPLPTPPYEPHLLVDVTLVEARTVAAAGVAPRLVLADSKLVPGQTLRATLELLSQIDEENRVRSVTWRGEGDAVNILKMVREVAFPPLKGLKTLKIRYDSPLPDAAVPGFYQITATAELEKGQTVSSTASFSVVEPFNVSVAAEPESVTILGPTPLRLNVDIFSAASGFVRGDVEIEVPAGWEVKGRRKKEFTVRREDSGTRAPFFLTLPSATQAGDYIVHAVITWRGKTWRAKRTVHVSRSTEAEGPKPEEERP